MNTKFYVPFETAKLLRKAGYPQSGSDMYYNPNSELKTQVELIAGYKEDYPTMIKYYIAAPAYCEVLDWLVSKDIYINVDRTGNTLLERGFVWHCYILERDTDDWCTATHKYPTREEAINTAIIGALEGI